MVESIIILNGKKLPCEYREGKGFFKAMLNRVNRESNWVVQHSWMEGEVFFELVRNMGVK